MQINIPKGFDTKVVNGAGTKLPYIGKGMKERGIERVLLDLELVKPKYVEPRAGGQMAAFEMRVETSTDETVHRAGDAVSYNTDLNSDYGQVDCKRFVARALGAIAARAPGYEETKDSAGNLLERKPRFAEAEDPNAVTSKDLTRVLTPDDTLHNALIGTRFRVEVYLHRYTPTKGKNVGIEQTVERYQWSVLSRPAAMQELQDKAKAAIERLNAKFKAEMEQAQAA